ncbi:hypothetical protein CYY_004536 [Polysphondylium violaceum]|uniref:Polyketide synthase n=1 Tax=Polysphondylium violaceum TaxID=133409 RepID=A0A8J4PW29_9MYCE|nr:hypothetical protein CYY_004536 [Polysphondylium violaceum]
MEQNNDDLNKWINNKRKRSNELMHKDNIYRYNPPDFKLLAKKYISFDRYIINKTERIYNIDWKDPNAVKELTKVLLDHDFNLKIELPPNYLCPTITLRVNYLCWVNELLQQQQQQQQQQPQTITKGNTIKGIDIGTGTSCIFPLLGYRLFEWSFIGLDIDPIVLEYAQKNIDINNLNQYISLFYNEQQQVERKQLQQKEEVEGEQSILKNYLNSTNQEDVYDFCICNPPFFKDEKEKLINPNTTCTASTNELITDGGELNFIKILIKESLVYSNRVKIFTTMVGKKVNLSKIQNELLSLNIPKDQIRSTELAQGKSSRWAISWSTMNIFEKKIKLNSIDNNSSNYSNNNNNNNNNNNSVSRLERRKFFREGIKGYLSKDFNLESIIKEKNLEFIKDQLNNTYLCTSTLFNNINNNNNNYKYQFTITLNDNDNMTFNNIKDENNDDIAIVGIGCRFPGGSENPNEFWNQMLNKFDGITKVPKDRWGTSYYEQDYINNEYGGLLDSKAWRQFDPLFFGISPKEAPTLDPQQRLLMTVLWEAFEDAQIKPSTLRGSDTGVFIGTMNYDYQRCQHRDISLVSPYTVTGNAGSFISNRLSFSFDLRGPSMTIDTACSSSLNAVYLGCQAIATGDCKMAIVGGVNGIFDPTISMTFSAFGMLGHKGQCRSFDAGADGFIRGEGAGVVILKKYKDALRDGDRVYCLVKGGSSNVDGYNQKTNITAPSMTAQSENIKYALNRSNVNPSDVYYIEAHGTGTPVGDPIEIEALSTIFKENHSPDNPLYIGSVKSNMGHLESAAGIASIVKVALMLKHRTLVPNIHFDKPNPKIDFENWNIRVVTQVKPFPQDKVVRMGVNSFGLSGSNCHMILEEIPQANTNANVVDASTNSKEYLVPFSANSGVSLDKYISTIFGNIKQYQETFAFEDFVKHQSLSKSFLVKRKVITASSWQDLIEKRNEVTSQSSLTSTISTPIKSTPIVFVFCGQGPQWKDMGKYLYDNDSVFRTTVDHCDNLLKNHFGYSVLGKLRSLADDSVEINYPILAQPSMFLIQAGLVAYYKQFNIVPSVVVGHSFGELSSALFAGLISLETAALVVYHRSVAQNMTIGTGRMLSIGVGYEEYISKIGGADKYPNIEIACYNSPDSIVITGLETELNQVKDHLSKSGVFCAYLGTPCSFHSSSQNVLKDRIFESLSQMPESAEPKVPFFSTVSGDVMEGKGFYNAQYIFDNLREPVKFSQAMENIYKYLDAKEVKNAIFLEIGPHPTLSFYVPKCKPQGTIVTPISVSPMHKKKEENQQMKLAISTMFCNGVEVDFSCQFNQTNLLSSFKENTSKLPRYQWDFEEYWEEPLASTRVKKGPSTSLLGNNIGQGNIVCELYLDVKKPAFSFLKGHKIKGKYLFPGAGYIDSLVNQFKGQDLTIYNLEFSTPFFLTEGVQHHLTASLNQTTKGEYKVEYFFKQNNNSDKWTKASNGRISCFPHSYKNTKRDITLLEKSCSETILTKKELYNKLLTVGLPYGPSFQRVESIMVGHRCSLGKLDISATSHLDLEFFNASSLDCALHCLLVLLEAPQEIVFDRLENFKLYSNNIPEVKPEFLYVYSRHTKTVGNSTFGNLEILTPEGLLLASFGLVKCTSLIRLKKPTIKYPTNELYSHHWQTKESPLPTPSSLLSILDSSSDINQFIQDKDLSSFAIKYLYSCLVNSFPDFNDSFYADGQDIQQQLETLGIESKHQQLYSKVLSIIKNHSDITTKSIDQLKSNTLIKFNKFSDEIRALEKNINSIIHILKGVEGEYYSPTASSPTNSPRGNLGSSCDVQEEQVENSITPTNKASTNQIQTISSTIKKLVKPLLDQRRLFKIIDFSNQDSVLSTSILSTLTQLLDGKKSNIEIEYTFALINESSTVISESIKQQFNDSSNLSIKHRPVNIDDFTSSGLLPTSYDIVISNNLLHTLYEVKSVIEQIYTILSPQGQLFVLESPKDVLYFELLQIVQPNHTRSIDVNGLKSILIANRFSAVETSLPESALPFVVQAQKQNVQSMAINFNADNEVFYNFEKFYLIVADSQENSTIVQDYKVFGSIFAQDTIVLKSSILSQDTSCLESITNRDIVFFLPGLDSLDLSNYKLYTMDYTIVNQFFLKNNISARFVLLTLDSQIDSKNYLNASLVGTFRYFLEFPQLNNFAIDVDKESIGDMIYILKLLDQEHIGDREFCIRNHQGLVQKIFKEPNLLQSSSYEKDSSNLYLNLNSNLEFAFHSREALPKDHVEIKVMAAGINYKDNLFYRGLLPQEVFSKGDIYNPPFGLECAGYISRVGSAVTKFKVGQQVVGFASHSLGSHVVTQQDRIVLKPESISFTDAAAVCVVYATSYYSLFQIGTFIPDKESILVHSATGGVGIATLNLLKWKRELLQKEGVFETPAIYATVGSKEKEDYLIQTYGDLITTIYNSRDTEYAELIKSSSEGVDLILNTLSGDYMSANFRSLSQIGRIMDLSVTQLVDNDALDFGHFKYHVGYQTIDLERASKYNSSIVSNILTTVLNAIADKSLANVPVQVFPARQVKDAIEYINERKHIGKIVVDFKDFETDILTPLLNDKSNAIVSNKVKKSEIDLQQSLKSTILITGQTGIAVQILKWILSTPNQISDVIVLSKSQMKWEIKQLINQNKSIGKVKFHFKSVDVVKYDDVNGAIKELYSFDPSIGPIKTVFHFATVYEYVLPEDITQSVIDNTHDPKAVGAVNLHKLSIENNWNLDNFVLFSSIAAILGGSKQSAYTSANFVLDALANHRKSIGLNAIAINWGALDAGGVVATDKGVSQFLQMQGILLVSLSKILGGLDIAFQNNQVSNIMLSKFNLDTLLSSIPQMKRKMEHHLTSYKTKTLNIAQSGNSDSVHDKVVNTISELLSIHPSKLNLDTRLKDYGIDSLLTVQLKNWIDKEYQNNLFTHLQLSSSSINTIIQRIGSKSSTTAPAKTSTPTPASLPKISKPNIESTPTPTIIQTPQLSFIPVMNFLPFNK